MMFERWHKGVKPESDEVIRHQIESGDAVPTIAEGLTNEDMFPYLAKEVNRLSVERPEDAKAFLAGLQHAEELLTQDSVTWEQVKETLEAAALIIGGAVAMPLLAYLLSGDLQAGASMAAISGSVAKSAIAGTALGNVGVGIVNANVRKQVLQRIRTLRIAVSDTR